MDLLQTVEGTQGLTKKELLQLTRERDKLEQALGGIKNMTALPDILVIIDTNKESIAIQEARKLKIPVVAVVDSNSNPDGIDFAVPGNDDALRAIELYCELFWAAVLDGIAEEAAASGGDIGASEVAPVEAIAEVEDEAPAETPVADVPGAVQQPAEGDGAAS
jgi:small subunit ribosomal protein S2